MYIFSCSDVASKTHNCYLNLAFLNLLGALTDRIFLQMFRLEDMKAEENALWMMTLHKKKKTKTMNKLSQDVSLWFAAYYIITNLILHRHFWNSAINSLSDCHNYRWRLPGWKDINEPELWRALSQVIFELESWNFS